MSNNIVVVGSCNIDFFSYAPKLPKAGETILGTKFVTGFGGKGANQCAAAAIIGGNTSFIARLGDDVWGTKYLDALNKLKINTKHISITPNQTSGVALITVDDSGQNQIVVVDGANGNLSVKDIENASQLVTEAAVLICQLETSVDVALKAIQLCKGVSILNGAPGIPNCNPLLLQTPTIFCVNETEAALFTGLPVESKSQGEAAIENLLKRGCKSVILTLGAEGSLFASQKYPKPAHIPCPKVNAVDTTGAGDAFIGALAYLQAEFPHICSVKRIKIASYMAAYSVTKPGTQVSFPDNEYFKKCIKENNLLNA